MKRMYDIDVKLPNILYMQLMYDTDTMYVYSEIPETSQNLLQR